MTREDLEAEGKVYDAEYGYLNAAPVHTLDLEVLILERMPTQALPPFATVLER
jgi:hypothetical protein